MTLETCRLTVAVLTFRRPRDLAAALPALAAQLASVSGLVADARVLVVDNSPEGDARELVEDFATTNEWSATVFYRHEAVPGIAAARNRALAESVTSDLLVFIDDDERPTEDWLTLLLTAMVRWSAAAVVGPVVSEYEVPPSDWIVAGRFFDRRRLPTGTPLTVAATNNLLLDLRVIRSLGLTFDVALGLNGGDDTLFTREIARSGAPMVWCDEAVVVDVVPQSRINRSWVTRRALRSGNSWVLSSVRLADSPTARWRARAAGAADGLTRVAGGVVRLALGCLLSRLDQRARGVRTLARGAGMVLGASGVSYLEYRRPNDSGQARSVAMARR